MAGRKGALSKKRNAAQDDGRQARPSAACGRTSRRTVSAEYLPPVLRQAPEQVIARLKRSRAAFVLQSWVRSSRYEARVVTRKRAVVQLQAGIRRRAVIRAVQVRKDSALEQMRATVRARPISPGLAASPATATSSLV